MEGWCRGRWTSLIAAGEGTWKVEDGNKLVLPDRVLEVVDADEGVLRVKRPR